MLTVPWVLLLTATMGSDSLDGMNCNPPLLFPILYEYSNIAENLQPFCSTKCCPTDFPTDIDIKPLL